MPMNRGEPNFHGLALRWQGKDKKIYTDESPDYVFETAPWNMGHLEIAEYTKQLRAAGLHANLDVRFRLSDVRDREGKTYE
jgi:hypothetical protein